MSGEEAFIDFVATRFETLGRDLVARIVGIVKQTSSFEYTFDELSRRKLKAPIGIIKASGDDHSFLLQLRVQRAGEDGKQDTDKAPVFKSAQAPDCAATKSETNSAVKTSDACRCEMALMLSLV